MNSLDDRIEFREWPKTPRLFRDIVITEKIDGTNAAVQITRQDVLQYDDGVRIGPSPESANPLNTAIAASNAAGEKFFVAAQSRKRLITPESDNYGFARWVFDNANDLATMLGEGRHYGEWWGQGIQRKYGIEEKRFSLFNRTRYPHLWDPDHVLQHGLDANGFELLPQLDVVPLISEGPFSEEAVHDAVAVLREVGSLAAPGFDKPEGIIVYHTAAGQVFKVLLENDELPKSLA